MAMDNFKEEIVVKRHSGLNTAVYYMSWVFIVLFGLWGIINVYGVLGSIGQGQGFDWVALLIALVMVGIAVLLFLKKDELRVEYEYTFTNGTLDVSKVMNNSKRKYLAEIPLKLVESCGSVNHPSFQRYLNDKTLKKHNWFLNRESDLIYLFFSKNSVKHLAIIEPSPEMQQMMRSKGYLNYGVWQETKQVQQ
ncbi:MAG: hypothetical protein IJU28_06095 [Clostridia bacterium]|nr:hypothetical protein [Clostridia bacterium]